MMANHEKFVKFYHAYKAEMPNVFLEKILDGEGDINNYIIPDNSCLSNKESYLIGSTVMHLVLNCRKDINILKILLMKGANFTIKNGKGSTVLHSSIENEFHNYTNVWKCFKHKPRDAFVDLILEAHIVYGNFVNPCDNNGISHFHIACITNNCEAVEFFLDNGVPVAQAVNKDSKYFAGYTPLHLAVECCAFDTAKVLLKYGASINDKNTRGITSFHLLIMQRMSIFSMIHSGKPLENIIRNDEMNEKLISLFLKNSNPDVIDDSGLSHFHVVCTMRDLSNVEHASNFTNDIDYCVNENSAMWSGYTALHFAAHCNVNIVKLLINKGANIEIKNKEGKTPFDLCLKRFEIEDIHYILSRHPIWKDVIMSDANTKLVDLVYAVQSHTTLQGFLKDVHDVNSIVPIDSTLWPGCTLLHIAVIFIAKTAGPSYIVAGCMQREQSDLSVLEELLNREANVGHQDVRGQTPVHVAFRLGNVRAVNLLLQFHRNAGNPVDQDNLSHLHIACAAQNQSVVEKLLSNHIDVNSPVLSTYEWSITYIDDQNKSVFFINAGSTALHICVANNSREIAKLLLKHGGDMCAKDDNSLTPIHRILTLDCESNDVSRVLFYSPVCNQCCSLMECIHEDTKLSHLHVASFAGHVDAVRRLLALGVDVDIGIAYKSTYNLSESLYVNPLHEPLSFLAKYNGFTPFHFAIIERNKEVAELLLQRGTNLFVRNFCCGSDPCDEEEFKVGIQDFISDIIFQNNEIVQERFEKDAGLTLLLDVDLVKSLLVKGADINARVHCNSPVWPGYTPLHVLMTIENTIDYHDFQEKINAVLSLLLQNGADVTLSNAMDDTPLHIRQSTSNYTKDTIASQISLMLRSQKNFKVNPVNREGISHFHIACSLNETAIVEEFLENGVEVNQSIAEFVDGAPGYTPLHLAISSEILDIEATRLLLEYGADVNARDVFDNTPFHLVCTRCNIEIRPLLRTFFRLYLEHGVNPNIHNIYGMTPLLKLTEFAMTIEDIDLFLRYSVKFNQFNTVTGEGCIAKIFYQNFYRSPMNCDKIMSTLNAHEIDDMNRTIIHNIVSLHNKWSDESFDQFKKTIDGFIKKGIDIDRQDNLGNKIINSKMKIDINFLIRNIFYSIFGIR